MRDEMEAGGGGVAVDRDAMMVGAANQVLQLASNSHKQAMQDLRDKVADLNVAIEACGGFEYTGGPGDQPFVIILKALLPRLLGNAYRDGLRGDELLAALAGWAASSVCPEDRQFLENFCEEHCDDEFFQPGPHMGGAAENALFEWIDSAITLSTMAD